MAKFDTTRGATIDPETYAKRINVALGMQQTVENTRQEMARTSDIATQEQARTLRMSMESLTKYNNALNSGSAAAVVNALADLTIAAKVGTPRNDGLLQRVNATAYEKNPNAATTADGAHTTNVNRDAWQSYLQQEVDAPGGNEQVRGNYDAMVYTYGEPSSDMLSSDSTLAAKNTKLRQTRNEQEQYALKYQGMVDEALAPASAAAKELIAKSGGTVREDDARNFLKTTASAVRSSVGVADTLDYLQKHADTAVELTGTQKESYDALAKQATEAEKIRDDLLAQANSESERDEVARILAEPKYQEWAEANGFDVGHVIPAEPGKKYNANTVTPSGIYVPGPDDHKALVFAQRQLDAGDGVHPFLHNALGQTPTYGRIEVKRPGAFVEDTSFKAPDGNYYYTTDGAGKHTYLTPEKAAEALRSPEQNFHTDTVGPKKQLTEVLTGQFGAPRLKDPPGSVVFNGKTYTPDQLASEPTVIGGGKDKPLKRYIEESRAAVKENRAIRTENALLNENEPLDVASWLAKSLHPPVASVAEEQKNAARADAASVAKRAGADTDAEVADATGRSVDEVWQQRRIAASGTNAYVDTAADEAQQAQDELDKIAADRLRKETLRNEDNKAIDPTLVTPPESANQLQPRPQTALDVTLPPAPTAGDQRRAMLAGNKPMPMQSGPVINKAPTPTLIRPSPAAPTAGGDRTPTGADEKGRITSWSAPGPATGRSLPATAEAGPLNQRHEYVVKTGRDLAGTLPIEQDVKNADRNAPKVKASADQRAALARAALEAKNAPVP